VETAVVITHTPTAVQGEASERRSQEENRRRALFRLRVNLALRVRHAIDPRNRGPNDAWRRHCRSGRITLSDRHDDFPAVLAEALDALQAFGGQLSEAARWLGCTSSQLTRLLKREPRALAQLNEQRSARGQRPLR
jgi:hypothetical protein